MLVAFVLFVLLWSSFPLNIHISIIYNIHISISHSLFSLQSIHLLYIYLSICHSSSTHLYIHSSSSIYIFYSLIIHPCHSSFNSSFTHHPSTHVTITHSCIHQSIHVLFVYPLTIQPASIPLSIHAQFIYPSSIHIYVFIIYAATIQYPHHPSTYTSSVLHPFTDLSIHLPIRLSSNSPIPSSSMLLPFILHCPQVEHSSLEHGRQVTHWTLSATLTATFSFQLWETTWWDIHDQAGRDNYEKIMQRKCC